MVEEESFPRGGKRIIQGLKRPQTTDDNLFKPALPPKAKKSKKSKKKEKIQITEDTFHSSINIQGTLSYNKIQDGMVILGCVRNITNFSLEVELPGLTFANISITNISDPFTKFMNERLEQNDHDSDNILRNRFQIGQMLPVKITNVTSKDDSIFVEASINPRDIYSDANHDGFKKDMLVWGCIQAIGDHGYEVSLGVKNCRVFLPSKNVDQGRSYAVGETLWCVIHKTESSNTASTLRVSAKENNIKSTKIEDINSLSNLLPGMQVELLTEKITKHGIHCKFLDKFFGYIDENYLKTSLKKVEDYREGQLLTGYVLYTEPITNITHLTLRGIENVPPPQLNAGDVVTAEVLRKARNGVYFLLPDKEKGFVTNKRILNSLKKNSNIDISEVISSKFTPQSTHTCKILDFNRLSKTYICTVEPNVVKQKIMNKDMLIVGGKYEVIIEKITETGLVVSCDGIKGFVPNLHISNARFTENIKGKYRERQKLSARGPTAVFSVTKAAKDTANSREVDGQRALRTLTDQKPSVLNNEEDNIIFTLKPSMVECDNHAILTSFSQAEPNHTYQGVVVSTTPSGAVVAFFGNTKGFLSKRQISNGEDVDPVKYFFRGQVITVKVLRVNDEKIQLTLKDAKPSEIKTGQVIVGFVKNISENDILIKSKDHKYEGIIPVCHLSNFPNINQAIKNTYKRNDKFTELICVSNQFPVTFSRKLAMELRENNFKLPKFEALRAGFIIKCLVVSQNDNGVLVTPILRNFSWEETISIDNKDIVESKKDATPKFEYHTILSAKVLRINHNAKKMNLSLKLSQVFDKNIETSVNYFTKYLSEINNIKEFGTENDWDICEYVPGQKITCKVEKLAENGGGCVVSLPNGCKGLVVPHLCPNGLKEGESLPGVFLSQDFQNNYADICLKQDINDKINKNQDAVIPKKFVSSCVVEKLLVKDDYILCVTKKNCNKQLVYVPLKLHSNDFVGTSSYYDDKKFKICICGKVKNSIIGISKRLFIKTEKERKKSIIVKEENNSTYNNTIEKEEQKVRNKKKDKKEKQQIIEESQGEDTEQLDTDSENNSSEEELEEQLNEDEEKIENIATTKTTLNTSNGPLLPSVSSFFNPTVTNQKVEEESSDDEEDEPTTKKKKKLTPSEKAEIFRLEEERIAKIEKQLADPNLIPESADQFDRLVLANPNSSELWTKYISFHMAATEVDKARTVAKRALETIDMTLIDEKFNIWIVLLNLENMFGTKESFDKVFEDAVKFNDSLQIYLKTIQMLGEAGKFGEMEEKIRKCRSKFKQEPSMWLEIAKTYYLINKFKEARNLKDGALKSISDKKTQMTIIVRFALMEFKYGEEEEGCAIFETIISTDPKKINIWTTYVDQLVKKGKIDQARLVLDRSVSHKLPLKNMKVLFMKYRKLEEEHGSPETVEEIKRRVQEYLSTVVK